MSKNSQITSLPLVNSKDFKYLNLSSGYLSVFNSSYFYILSAETYPSKPKPVLIWLNGGPGCSSLDGFFLENGPLRFGPSSITVNPGYWNDYDMLYIDNPPGAGYSTGEPYTKTTQVIDGLKEFYRLFKEIYNYEELYLGGESFAGVWVPLLAMVMDVKGIILGNPWIDPLYQYPSVLDYSKRHGLLSGKFLEKAELDTEQCLRLMTGKVRVNYDKCEDIIAHVLEESKNTGFCINKYDYTVRDSGPNQQCGMNWPVGISEMKVYLGRNDVKKALHSSYKPVLWYIVF
jgi:carboxypeptidase D